MHRKRNGKKREDKWNLLNYDCIGLSLINILFLVIIYIDN